MARGPRPSFPSLGSTDRETGRHTGKLAAFRGHHGGVSSKPLALYDTCAGGGSSGWDRAPCPGQRESKSVTPLELTEGEPASFAPPRVVRHSNESMICG